MPITTLTGARFDMEAMLLHPGQVDPDPINPDEYGKWVKNQDPLTGEIIQVWVPYDNNIPDDPNTPQNDSQFRTIRCLARGIVDGGIRVAGSTQTFGDTYANMEYVKMWTPAKTIITKSDRITNIKTPDGHIQWVDDFYPDPQNPTIPKATVFNVNGVTPLFDAFNRHVENFVLLARAEVSDDYAEL